MEFEPHATSLEQKGEGYVVASLGEDSGYVPYTSFSAKKSYLEKNKDTVQAFTDALQKGMDYVQDHSPEEIAKAISPQFPETDMETLTTIVTRYYSQDTWKDNLIFEEDAFTGGGIGVGLYGRRRYFVVIYNYRICCVVCGRLHCLQMDA